jgi:peptide/nickel transport system permease protein
MMADSTVGSDLPPTHRNISVLSRIRRLPRNMLIGGVIILIYFFVGLTGRFWAPYNYSEIGTGPPYSSPSLEHPFGTDNLGRDVFSRVIYGTAVVLLLSLTSTLIATIIGGMLGLLSGYVGGVQDEFLTRVLELMVSVPVLIFALLVITAAGLENSGSMALLIIVVALVWLPRTARMSRSIAVDIATRDFVTVAKARGESTWSIVRREVAPMATGVLLVEFGVRAGYAPILIGSLGFLGFGVRPPIPEWGVMISENRAALATVPVVVLAPALALAGLVIGLNLFTEGLARVLGRQVHFGGA